MTKEDIDVLVKLSAVHRITLSRTEAKTDEEYANRDWHTISIDKGKVSLDSYRDYGYGDISKYTYKKLEDPYELLLIKV